MDKGLQWRIEAVANDRLSRMARHALKVRCTLHDPEYNPPISTNRSKYYGS